MNKRDFLRSIGASLGMVSGHEVLSDGSAKSIPASAADEPFWWPFSFEYQRSRDNIARTAFYADAGWNVKEFGAKGDNSTDDTRAIQMAIDAAQEAGGGVVLFPPGEYVVSNSLVVTKSRIILRGQQVGQSISSGTTIRTISTMLDVILVTATAQAISGFAAQNLNLIGNANGTKGSGIRLVSIPSRPIYQFSIEHVAIGKCAEHGVHLDATTDFIFNGNLSVLNLTSNGKTGMMLTGACGQLAVFSCYCEGNMEHQINVDGTAAYNLSNVAFYRCTAAGARSSYAGVRLHYAANISFYDVFTEANTTYEVLLLSCRGVRFEGGSINQSGLSRGMVLGFDGRHTVANIQIDVPGWTNRTTNARIDTSTFAGATFDGVVLGNHADGPFAPPDIAGLASIAAHDANAVVLRVKPSLASTVPLGSGISLENAKGRNVTALNLTPGRWLVYGNVQYALEVDGVYAGFICGISEASDTPPLEHLSSASNGIRPTGTFGAIAPTRLIAVTATTPIYLVALATYSGGSVVAFGSLLAHQL